MGRFSRLRKKKQQQAIPECDVINPAVWIEKDTQVEFEGRLNLECAHRNKYEKYNT